MKIQILKSIIEKKENKSEFAIITNLSTGESEIFEKDKPLSKDLIVLGEIGLTGEIRPVPNGQERINEAQKHGFTKAIVPRSNRPKNPIQGIEVHGVGSLSEALEVVKTVEKL